MKRNEDILQELKLRRFIRKALRLKQRKEKIDEKEILKEELKLRTIIRHLIAEGDVDSDMQPAPYASTPVNALADAFNQILPVLKTGLRKLAKPEERVSYRAHVLSKFKTIFDGLEGFDVGGGMVGEGDLNEQETGKEDIEGIQITLDDPDRIMPSDGKEDDRFKEPEKDPEKELEDQFDTFKMAGQNPTGARVAFETINDSNIEQVLSDKRKGLFDSQYKEEFKKYALYNVDLWILTYEKELADSLGQQPAFTSTIMPRPAGAEVRGTAQEFAQGPGDTEAIEGIPGLEDIDVGE